MRIDMTRLLGAVLCAASLFAAAARAQNIEPFYASDYTLTNLGIISDLPTQYGAVIFKSGDPQTILIGGGANHDGAGIYEVTVTRDVNGHITGFSGTATKIADAPGSVTNSGIDGGLAYGPDNVLFYTTFGDNHCGQIKPGSVNPDKLIDLTALGVLSSTGAVGFVPPGFAGAGRIKFSSYSGHEWYDASVSPDGAGTFHINGLIDQVTLPNNGPEGFAYVKGGHPSFTADSIVQVEEDSDLVATYEIDSTGDPVLASRRVLADMGSNSGPAGCAFDPITGDLLISNFSGSNLFLIKGFLSPKCFTDADADGTADCDDGCPDDANKTQPGACGCGTADTDTDGDGVCDSVDLCPGQDDTLDANGNNIPDCLEQSPAGQPAGDCCGGGMDGMMVMPMTLLGMGWMRRRRTRRCRRTGTAGTR